MNPYERERPLWRSLLFVPVNVRAYVVKAHTRGAYGIILDLEDSVPLAEKANARGMVAEAAKLVSRNGADVLVRVNEPLELFVRDLETVISPEICALLLPKIDSASHVRMLAQLPDRSEAENGLPLGHPTFSVLVETARASQPLAEPATAHPRIVAVRLGSEASAPPN